MPVGVGVDHLCTIPEDILPGCEVQAPDEPELLVRVNSLGMQRSREESFNPGWLGG